ncbi:MAG: hypothetical protein OXE75_09545 [bacterium]|nr:hypothetical protein [bacterium]
MSEENTGLGVDGRETDDGFLRSYLPFLLHRSYQLLSCSIELATITVRN